jgi:hypothetical protein
MSGPSGTGQTVTFLLEIKVRHRKRQSNTPDRFCIALKGATYEPEQNYPQEIKPQEIKPRESDERANIDPSD